MLWYAPENVPDLRKQHVIVTSTDGIALATTTPLAAKGAHVVLAGSNALEASRAMQDVEAKVPGAQVEFMPCNFHSFKSIKEFADSYKRRGEPLHVLINHAQPLHGQVGTTEDGFEVTLGTHYFGLMYLTLLLLDVLHASGRSRIIFRSSPMEEYAHDVDWQDLRGKYASSASDPQTCYHAALYAIMLARELQYQVDGSGIDVFATHPGTADPELTSQLSWLDMRKWRLAFFQTAFGQTDKRGALSTLYCATEPSMEGKGFGYYGPCYNPLMVLSLFKTGRRRPYNPHAVNEAECRRLFDDSLRIVNKAAEKATGQRVNLDHIKSKTARRRLFEDPGLGLELTGCNFDRCTLLGVDQQMAYEYRTLDRILERDDVQKWLAYAVKQRTVPKQHAKSQLRYRR
ncbi:hypothetical protein WJX72_007246 [[Myrmecia] bisecta]|uniref:Uncharacterized protein n=1 Tax=[Myrmecia] bisecta TaxID=41462 RepID=A0AAW1P3G3_9CHLO